MKLNIDASSANRSFLLYHCFRKYGQTANCAPSRKSGCFQSVGGAVSVSQHPFDVGFTVEDFTAQLNVGNTPLVTVVLKCPAAHLQPCRHLLVGEETFPVQCRAIVGSQMLYIVQQTVEAAHEVDYPLVVFVNGYYQLCTILGLYSPAFESCFLPSVLHDGDDTLHVFGTVIGLVVYL